MPFPSSCPNGTRFSMMLDSRIDVFAEADYHPNTGKAHRAMADAEMAANLTAHLAQELRQKHGLLELSHDLLAAKINEHLKRHRGF